MKNKKNWAFLSGAKVNRTFVRENKLNTFYLTLPKKNVFFNRSFELKKNQLSPTLLEDKDSKYELDFKSSVIKFTESVLQIGDDHSLIKDKIIGFIGGGKIARCLIQALIAAGHPKEKIIVSNRTISKLETLKSDYGVQITVSNITVAESVDVIIMAVKSQILESVSKEIKSSISFKKTLVVSLAPGISTDDLSSWLGSSNIIRCMTNIAISIGQGATVLYASQEIPDSFKKIAEMIFLLGGKTVWLTKEKAIDTVTPLIISAAYFYLIVEAVEKSAVKKGVPPEIAYKLSRQIFYSAACMVEKTQKSVTKLREEITTPKGVTEQSIEVLINGNIFSLFDHAFDKAEKRSEELGKISSAKSESFIETRSLL